MRVALVTCADYPLLTDDDRPLIGAFARCSATAVPVHWDVASVEWSDFDLVVLRSCWDYHVRPQEFRAWLERLLDSRATVLNAVELVQWNMNKRYLAELKAQGVNIPPTVWLTRGDTTTLPELFSSTGWADAVVKPTVSASAMDTWRVCASSAEEHQPAFQALLGRCDVMVQKFVNEVTEYGELSLIFIAGEFSHAILKRPSPGDFRVQEELGGVAGLITCRSGIIAQAKAIVALLPQLPHYARIDGVVIGQTFQLMEAECIEPKLYLADYPASYDRFARGACVLKA